MADYVTLEKGIKDATDSEKIQLLSFDDVEWYWGDIPRDAVDVIMEFTEDGTFIVRDASSGKKGEYTLTLRKDGTNKRIKIQNNGRKFGFSEPYIFDSVLDLINFYRHHTLENYNPALDIMLKWSVGKPPEFVEYYKKQKRKERIELVSREKVLQIWDHLANTYDELSSMIQVYDGISIRYMNEKEKLAKWNKRVDKYRRSRDLIENQLLTMQRTREKEGIKKVRCTMYQEILEGESGKKEEAESEKEYNEYEQLKRRKKLQNEILFAPECILKEHLLSVESTLMSLEETQQEKAAFVTAMERQLILIKPDLIMLYKRKEDLCRWLDDHGVDMELVQDILISSDENVTIRQMNFFSLPHQNKATWYLPMCNRKEAEQLLKNKKEGTFLIRSSRTGHLALSVVSNGIVNHCIVYQTPEGYGFVVPLNVYKTLKHLVLHYTFSSLIQHNELLRTTLKYPVFEELANTLKEEDVEKEEEKLYNEGKVVSQRYEGKIELKNETEGESECGRTAKQLEMNAVDALIALSSKEELNDKNSLTDCVKELYNSADKFRHGKLWINLSKTTHPSKGSDPV